MHAPRMRKACARPGLFRRRCVSASNSCKVAVKGVCKPAGYP